MSEADSPPIDRRTADIAIICSHEAEVRPLIELLDRSRRYSDNGMVFRGGFLKEVIRVAIVEAGSGYSKHREATETLIDEHRPAWLISTGLCSALSADLQVGQLCVADELIDEHGQQMEVQSPVKSTAQVHVGRFLVADAQPFNQTGKRTTAESSDAICCDTTSLAVAQVCIEKSTEELQHSFIAVKAIVESSEEVLPEDIHRAFYDPLAVQPKNLMGKLASRLKKNQLAAPWQERLDTSTRNLNRYLVSIMTRLAEKLGKTVY